MIRSRRKRREKAAALAEFAVAVTLVVPIVIILLYVTYQACIYLYLKTGVDAAAKTQARWLAINFNFLCAADGNSAANYGNWKAGGTLPGTLAGQSSPVRVANCVINDGQITNGTINANGSFNANGVPATLLAGQCLPSARGQGQVAVRVLYPGGSTLPPWPNPPLSFMGYSLTPTNVPVAGIYVCDIEP